MGKSIYKKTPARSYSDRGLELFNGIQCSCNEAKETILSNLR